MILNNLQFNQNNHLHQLNKIIMNKVKQKVNNKNNK